HHAPQPPPVGGEVEGAAPEHVHPVHGAVEQSREHQQEHRGDDQAAGAGRGDGQGQDQSHQADEQSGAVVEEEHDVVQEIGGRHGTTLVVAQDLSVVAGVATATSSSIQAVNDTSGCSPVMTSPAALPVPRPVAACSAIHRKGSAAASRFTPSAVTTSRPREGLRHRTSAPPTASSTSGGPRWRTRTNQGTPRDSTQGSLVLPPRAHSHRKNRPARAAPTTAQASSTRTGPSGGAAPSVRTVRRPVDRAVMGRNSTSGSSAGGNRSTRSEEHTSELQ